MAKTSNKQAQDGLIWKPDHYTQLWRHTLGGNALEILLYPLQHGRFVQCESDGVNTEQSVS